MKLTASHPALTEARTIHTKAIRPVMPDSVLLKPAADNAKLGKGYSVIRKGAWRGMPLFTLTLPERSTCPPDCVRWEECYGNGMAFAHRWQPSPEFEAKLAQEVATLARFYPHGFVIRLHILGDFYSVEYVGQWLAMLAKHGALRVFGYTARHGFDPIWTMLERVRMLYGDRFWIRQSRNMSHDYSNPLLIYAAEEDTVPNAIACPEQTGATDSCLSCGLCWSVKRTITFQDHDKLNKARRNAKATTA
jgi:hypothetical protein